VVHLSKYDVFVINVKRYFHPKKLLCLILKKESWRQSENLCHVASYCSKSCQKEHWKQHKIHCIENHTAFYGMDRSILFLTLKQLFKKTNMATMPYQLHMGYGQVILKTDPDSNFKKVDQIYSVEAEKIFESFRQLISSSIKQAQKVKQEISGPLPEKRVEYLQQLDTLAQKHKGRYFVDVTIELVECVGNFQFKICLIKPLESKSSMK
jgi:MYND finger